MHVIASFESSLYLEIALEKLKEQDFEDNRIVLIEMELNKKDKQILDTMYHSNGISFFDSMAAWAVVGATLGCIYGSILKVGPIILGLAGAILFGIVGFILDFIITKKKNKKWGLRNNKKKYYDVLLIIRCKSKQEIKKVISICENNHASSMGVNS